MSSLLAFLTAMLCAPLGFSCLLIQWLVRVTLVLDVGVPALGCASRFLPECRFVEVVAAGLAVSGSHCVLSCSLYWKSLP